MRVVLLGADPTLAETLGRAGIEVGQVEPPAAGEGGATGALAGALRAAEEVLAGDPPDALLVGGDGDPALGGALTAVKLGIPTAWLRPADAPRDGLVGRVADLSLDATTDAEAVAAAVRELAAPTIPAR
jgi:hypothetical protein